MENDNTTTKVRPKPTLSKWIYCIIACLCTVLFVMWTGYYAVLILIPIFIDIYITKFIPWGGWRNAKNPTLRKILDWVDAILFALVGVYIINTFFFQNYQIPTSSLEKSLLVGDFLCVSKFSYGARSPMTPFTLPLTQHTIPGLNVKSYLDKPQLEYKRFKGSGQVERNDIVVFNYPSGDTVALNLQQVDYYWLAAQLGRDLVRKNLDYYGQAEDYIKIGSEYIRSNPDQYGEVAYRPVDRRENYVKRCVGLPGDTLSFIDDVTYVNGIAQHIPINRQLKYVVQTDGSLISESVFDELELSNEDRVYSHKKYATDTEVDSLRLIRAGLKPNGKKETLVYYNVYLTQEKVDKLLQKPFVLTVMTQNDHLNRLGSRRNMIDNPAYPLNYYQNKEVRHGDFPALWIPKKGETIKFDTDVDYKVAAYERCIKNYEFNDFKYENGQVYINGEPAKEYTFKLDYYFMVGDNRDNSADSRVWGFVPEDHIVGKPMFIWLSLDKDKGWFSGKIRWSRLFTSGNKNQ